MFAICNLLAYFHDVLGGASLLSFYANPCNKRRLLVVSLLFTWMCGILLGYLFYEPSLFPMMRSVIVIPVSIVGLVSCMFLPLLCSCFSILLDKPIIILIVCFIKAVSFGFSCAMLTQMFSSAAWMIRLLFLFSDSCFCVILLILWFRRFTKPCIHGLNDFLVCFLLAIGIAVADGYMISPFLQGLF